MTKQEDKYKAHLDHLKAITGQFLEYDPISIAQEDAKTYVQLLDMCLKLEIFLDSKPKGPRF